ncbi:MAG TPA: RidA family protein [Dehalococcoidia bacterium]
MRKNISSGSPFEPVIGFSRAVRIGNVIAVSGTVGRKADGSMEDGVYAQAKAAIATIEAALRDAGASLADVIRTRIYVTDLAQDEEVFRAHKEAFGDIRPASSLVCIKALATPEMLVEFEADAVIES